MRQPVLSIVIANYNFGRFLGAAIKSITSQCSSSVVCDDGRTRLALDEELLELIVVDGGSVDKSVNVIKENEGFLTWWISEKDRGQSHAFNKGFAQAKGKYLTWLNADDIFLAGCLRFVIKALVRHPTCSWFTANHLRFLDSDKSIIQVEWGPNWYPRILQHKNSPIVIFGPSSFFSREIWERVGKIDEDLHFAMDTDLWLRFMAAGYKQRRINCFCWAFRMHEASKTAEYEGHRYSEDGPTSKLKAERQIAVCKVGYKESRLIRLLSLSLRILDMSLIVRQIKRITLLGKSVEDVFAL